MNEPSSMSSEAGLSTASGISTHCFHKHRFEHDQVQKLQVCGSGGCLGFRGWRRSGGAVRCGALARDVWGCFLQLPASITLTTTFYRTYRSPFLISVNPVIPIAAPLLHKLCSPHLYKLMNIHVPASLVNLFICWPIYFIPKFHMNPYLSL